MAAPGWYFTDPGDVLALPRPWRWNSNMRTHREIDIVHRTIREVVHAHKLARQRVLRPVFRLPEIELDRLKMLHDAAAGILRPFYFVPNMADMATVWFVRKEEQFEPVPVFPGAQRSALAAADLQGAIVQWFDYELQLTEEIPPADILA